MGKTIKIQSTRLGEVKAEESTIVTLPEGMLGFSESKRYAIIPHGKGPFRWLQSLDDPALAFLVVDPWVIKPDYEPIISQTDARALELGDDSLKIVYVVVTVPPGDPEGMTANLLGPVIVNADSQTARQVVVLNDSYTTEYSVLEGLRAMAHGQEERSVGASNDDSAEEAA